MVSKCSLRTISTFHGVRIHWHPESPEWQQGTALGVHDSMQLPLRGLSVCRPALQLGSCFRLSLQDEDMDDAEKKWRTERRGGNYGAGTKEMQVRA